MTFRFSPLLLASALALAVPAHAGEQVEPAPPLDDSTAIAEFNGMKVAVDRKTGELRPLTPEESRGLEQMVPQQARQARAAGRAMPSRPATDAAAVATARPLKMGGTAMKLPESQLEYLTATRDADGNLVLTHSSDVQATEELPHE